MSCVSKKLGVPAGTERIVLCFGFQHSKAAFPMHRDDSTGAEILIDTLRKRFVPKYYPIIVTYEATARYVLNEINTGIYFDSKTAFKSGNMLYSKNIFANPFDIFSLVAEIEEVAYRHKYYQSLNPQAVRRAILAKISFWSQFLSEFKDVFYLNGNVPHVLDDLITYRLAQNMGHQTLCAYRLPIVPSTSARLMFFSDAFRQDSPIPLPSTASSQARAKDLNKVIEIFATRSGLNGIKQKRSQASGVATDRWRGKTILNRASAVLNRASELSIRFYWWTRKLFSHDGRRALITQFRYNRRAGTSLPKRFIYFPLHMQPEASSSPLGGIYTDQEILIAALAEALPEGVKLVVKEHPQQLRAPLRLFFRRDGFYKRICALNNVVLLHHSVPATSLLSRCLSAVTLTGTTAFEALAIRKHCFVMGASPFVKAPNAIVPKNQEELREAMTMLASENMPLIEDEEIEEFLNWLRDHSVFGYLDPYTHPRLEGIFSQEENIEAVSNALCEAIDHVREHNDTSASIAQSETQFMCAP